MENKKSKVMVIDKDIDFIMSVISMLDDIYKVVSSNSLFDAMQRIKSEEPDVILLDYETLQNGGTGSIDAIRLARGGDEIPVIFLSDVNKRAEVKKALSMRPDWYILKPPTREKLVSEIERAIESHKSLYPFTDEPPSSDDISELLKQIAALV